MWTRKELKERAKESLKRNYWKVVLVSLIITLIGGGTGSGATAAVGGHGHSAESSDNENVIVLDNEGNLPIPEDREIIVGNMMDEVEGSVNAAFAELEQASVAVWVSIAVVVFVWMLVFMAIVICIDIFILNPLCVGTQRFMLKSVDGTGSVGELGYTFDHNYKNGVKTAFFRDLYIFLWSLLFVIPGIYKKYQYYMVDYILAENPDMPYQEVLALSKKMMDGNKWKTFVLDISFILWYMLSALTCGILSIFYVVPYKQLTRASLYRALQVEERQ